MQTTPASANADPGFKLPAAASAAAEAGPAKAADAASLEVAPLAGAPAKDSSTRDLAIGGAVFLVLLLVYFFVRNAYVHHMVVRRVAPSSAGSAGWLLFLGLAFISAAAVMAIINPSRFLSLAVSGALVLVGLVALVAALLVGRR
ncbi:MAG: hypothetical protein V4508_12470 [Pseudomonadota bacterium]